MENDPLLRLQKLQRDLVSFTESRLTNIDRLNTELDASVEEFRNLLERKRRNKASRDALSANPDGAGKYKVVLNEVEYKINNDFCNGAVAVADTLDLDELEAAKLYLGEQSDSSDAPDILPLRAVLRYHKQRETLLHCLRLLLWKAADDYVEGVDSEWVTPYLDSVIQGDRGLSSGSTYWKKCVEGLGDIEASLKNTQDHIQMLITTNTGLLTPTGEVLQAERMLLTHQHEALATCMTYLITTNRVRPEDFKTLVHKAASAETPLDVMAHYTPILLRGFNYFSEVSNAQDEAAHDLHKMFAPGPGQLQWKMKQMQAATTIWWLAEYSGRVYDGGSGAFDTNKLDDDRNKLWKVCCNGKAFHLMLATVEFLSPEIWYDPAKAGLVSFLLDNSCTFPPDASAPSRDFALLVMDQLQDFIRAFVSNMPNFLRSLQMEEDQERLNFRPTPQEQVHFQPMNLERFMLVIAGAYNEIAPAAEDFWQTVEGEESDMYGFLVWASQRLPTPRVAAFCEMLRAISNDEGPANNAHRFLLTEHAAKDKKDKCGVTWMQIFAEIEVYATANQRKPTVVQPMSREDTKEEEPDITEKETPIMLEAYLRLATHVCENSPEARHWILHEQSFHIHDQLLQLVASATPSNVQACCFDLLAALATEKTAEVNAGLWNALDTWIAGGGQAGTGIPRPQTSVGFRAPSEKQYLQHIGANPEVATAFVRLLIALVVPLPSKSEAILDTLPFPEALGGYHRQVGIEPYVDFVLGQVFCQPLAQPGLYENRMLSNVLRHACLTFAALCLSTFNEDLIILANESNLPVDATIRSTSLATYVKMHPFARTMEHMFNNNTIAALFDSLHQLPEELETLTALSPLTQSTLKAVEVMDLTMKLQPTYFDIVRPLIKTRSTSRPGTVANAAIASFDEVVLGQLDAVVYLEHFATCDHTELALGSLELLRKLSSSKKLTTIVESRTGQKVGNRLVARVQEGADSVASILRHGFEVDDADAESIEQPLKFVRARAILDLLNSSIDASPSIPSIAHSLLGLLQSEGHVRSYDPEDGSLFGRGLSLFHILVKCAVELPTTYQETNVSWLLALKRGCMEIVTKLAAAPMTASLVQTELRSMDFLPAMAVDLLKTPVTGPWDNLATASPQTLLEPAGCAIRDLMKIREAYLEYAALEVRALASSYKKSVLEKNVEALLGTFIDADMPLLTASLLSLIDFFDLIVADSLVANRQHLADLDLSSCVSETPQALVHVDLRMAKQYLALRKVDLLQSGKIKDANEEYQLNDEIAAVLASARTSNLHSEIMRARSDAVEAWADALSTVVTVGGLPEPRKTALAVQALQVVLLRFEKSLGDNIDAAGLFARLTLTLVHAASSTTVNDRQIASTREERLATAFRISVKAITDSETGPALRDVCYRTICTILAFTPETQTDPASPSSLSPHHLATQVQASGERILRAITADAFSGRGSTRVSALLCLDALLSLFRAARASQALLRALTKLNFVPVLIDSSVGHIETAFQTSNSERDLPTMLSYFHTALALILNLCTSPEGTQLLLTSGFFTSVSDSQLFSTDPDIGLDVDNPAALREFCRILSAILRVVTAAVAAKGPGNGVMMQQAKAFLAAHRFSILAVFKRTSRVDRAGGQGEAEAKEVADEFARLMLLTGFLEDDEQVHAGAARRGGFT